MVALRAVIAIVAATAGALLAMGRKRVGHRVLCGMVSFAAGALLAVTVAHIAPEAIEMLGWLPAALSLAGGTLVFAMIGKYVYFLCPACAASASEHDGGYLRLGLLLMVALGIHSTVDGLAISAGMAGTSSIGVLILFAVSYHKVPEGLALASIARLAGYGRARALAITVLIELTTALGAFIGIVFLRGVNDFWLGVTLGVVAGSFLYTVGFALLREMYAHEKASIILYVILGFASILALSALIAPLGLPIHH
jgi:ZIP family zinc transporter